MDAHVIAHFVQGFFHEYLAARRGLSPNTVLSYRDSLKLFLRFVSQRLKKSVDKLVIEDFDEKLTAMFLDDLETTRGNCTQTRNNRLAALHSLFRYIAEQDPTVLACCQRICSIPLKRADHKTIEYLDDQEVQTLLDSVERNSRNGPRDGALLLFLYNTGARAQEAVGLEASDLRLVVPFQVKLKGKGRKQRVCPLWPETVAALENYLDHREPDTSKTPLVFLNARGQPMTRFGLRYIVRKYVGKANQACTSLESKAVSPHTFRHTTAMHLLQSGNDLSVVKDWMGHADLNTTHAYIEIDMKMKRKALEACEPPKVKTRSKRRRKWQEPNVLKWLDELSATAGIMCSTRRRNDDLCRHRADHST